MLSIENTRSSSRIWPIADGERKSAASGRRTLSSWSVGIDVVMDFLGRLPDEEQAAGDQDQVAPGEAVAERLEDRRRSVARSSATVPSSASRMISASADADPACARAAVGRQLVGEDRDEDQVVDAEHDLHDDERDECNPGGWILHQTYNIHRRFSSGQRLPTLTPSSGSSMMVANVRSEIAGASATTIFASGAHNSMPSGESISPLRPCRFGIEAVVVTLHHIWHAAMLVAGLRQPVTEDLVHGGGDAGNMAAMGEDDIALRRQLQGRKALRQIVGRGDFGGGHIAEAFGLAFGLGADAVGDIADLAGDMAEILVEFLPERGNPLRGFIGIGFRKAGEQHCGAGLETRRVEFGEGGCRPF